jgi:hypothetical protein
VKEVKMPSRRKVGSVMTTEVTTVGPDTPFKAVALLLATWNLRVFLRTDREVREEVLLREMAMDPASLYVSVHNGIVTLNGTVERTSMIPVIVALIRRVDGVVEVRQTLKGSFDDRGVSPVPPGPAGILSSHKPRS